MPKETGDPSLDRPLAEDLCEAFSEEIRRRPQFSQLVSEHMIDILTVPDAEDEHTIGNFRVDNAVVADTVFEQPFEFTNQRDAGIWILGECPLERVGGRFRNWRKV